MSNHAPSVGCAVRRCIIGVSAASLLAVVPPVAAVAAPPTAPYISEIHYDNTSTDMGEFVEVHLSAGTTSAGFSVVLYNGGSGASNDTDPVPAVTAPANAGAVAVVGYPANGIQNGDPDGVALVDAAGRVVEFVSYEGTMTATNGPAAGRTSTDIGVREAGTEPAGQSVSRSYDPTVDALVWAGPAPDTRGVVNAPTGPDVPPPAALCETAPTHEIGAVQGNTDAMPLTGQQVTVRGVVVGDVPGLAGFYLHDGDGDANAATSDGVFVFSTVEVDLGDTVAVTGQARSTSGRPRSAPAPTPQCAPTAPPPIFPALPPLTFRRVTPNGNAWRACWWSRWTL